MRGHTVQYLGAIGAALALTAAISGCHSEPPAGVGGGGGAGNVPVACELEVPEGIELGPAPAPLAVSAQLLLRNRRDRPCELTDVRLVSCGDAFALETPPRPVVPASGSLPLTVTLAPGEEGEVSCAVAIGTPEREWDVALLGRRDPDCLGLEPAVLDFGSLSVGCGMRSGSFRVRNRCAVPVTIAEAGVEGSGFAVRGESLPLALEVGGDAPFDVDWEPAAEGLARGAVRIGLDPVEIAPRVVELAGEALSRRVVDTYPMPRGVTDILVVLDDGASMAPLAEHVTGELAGLPSYLDERRIDYRLALVTTGIDPEPEAGCPGGVDGGADGRFFPVVGAGPRILTPETPDRDEAWTANLAVGGCRTGPSLALEAARRALTPPLVDNEDDPRHPEPADGNAGFLREQAKLLLVFVSAREDASDDEVTPFYYSFQALKGFRNTHLFNAVAVVADGEGCGEEAGARLAELAAATTGGEALSLCSERWARTLRDLADHFTDQFPFGLSAVPVDPSGLVVRVDGVEVPPFTPEGERDWWYSPGGNEIAFEWYPPPGSTVEIEYNRTCP